MCAACLPEGQTVEVTRWLSADAGHALQRSRQPEQQRACNSCVADARPRVAARAQAGALAALAVRGHPTPIYNDVYTLSEHTDDGWPVYQMIPPSGDRLYLTRHTSELWVLCPQPARSLAEEQVEKAATIRAPEGRVPLGSHTWTRGGAAVRITLAGLATQREAEAEAAAILAEKAAAEALLLAASQRQLAGVAAVRIDGIQVREYRNYNTVFSAAGEHDGWPRFQSAEGGSRASPPSTPGPPEIYYLYYLRAGNKWVLNNSFTPDRDTAIAFVSSPDGLLPADSESGGGTEWSVLEGLGGRWQQALIKVSLLSTDGAHADQMAAAQEAGSLGGAI